MINYAENLSEEQLQICWSENNLLVKACPGSGKTRTITYKLAYRIEKHPDNVKKLVAITYTNRAADEITQRIEDLGIDSNASISSAMFKKIDFQQNVFKNVSITRTMFFYDTFEKSDFASAQIIGSKFYKCKFVESKLLNLVLENTDFTECKFKNIDFTSIKYENVTFEDCEFENVTFTGQQKKDFGME